MSSLHDGLDAAEIFAAALVYAIFVGDARNQLQSYSGVDVMIEGLHQRFTDFITAEGFATTRQFFVRTLAKLPPTINIVYSAALNACN